MRKWFSFLFLNEEHLHHAVEKLTRGLSRVADALEAGNNTQSILHRIAEMEKRIMATQQEITDRLNAATAKVTKIGTETRSLLDKIAVLQAAIDNLPTGTATPELVAAADALDTQVDVVDALVPDSSPTPPTT